MRDALMIELLSLICWQDMQMEVSPHEQGITESWITRGRRGAVKSNHYINKAISIPTPTPKVSLTMEAQEKYLRWRCELEGEMEKQSDSQGEGNARKYETKEGSSYYSQNPPRRCAIVS